MSINNVGLFSRGRDVIFFGPRKNINPIWPHPPSKSPFGLLWEVSATSFMTMAYSVWYFYYWTYFLLFSLITFTTELKLAPQDLLLFTFTFTIEHYRADLGSCHKKNWLFVHSYHKWRCLNITDSEWLDCLINSMSVHHHLDLEIDTLKRKIWISALFFVSYSYYMLQATSWCYKVHTGWQFGATSYKLVLQGLTASPQLSCWSRHTRVSQPRLSFSMSLLLSKTHRNSSCGLSKKVVLELRLTTSASSFTLPPHHIQLFDSSSF